MDSFTQSFTPEQIQMFNALLAMAPPIDTSAKTYHDRSESDDYITDESDSDSDEQVKRHVGRPKKVRSPEWIASREASKARGRGRPRVERTPEQLADMAAAIATKEARKADKEAKKVEREVADVIKQQTREARVAKAAQKALEKAARDASSKAKRTEIYQKMIADAEAYKAKWEL
jgi:hypothetical protein